MFHIRFLWRPDFHLFGPKSKWRIRVRRNRLRALFYFCLNPWLVICNCNKHIRTKHVHFLPKWKNRFWSNLIYSGSNKRFSKTPKNVQDTCTQFVERNTELFFFLRMAPVNHAILIKLCIVSCQSLVNLLFNQNQRVYDKEHQRLTSPNY